MADSVININDKINEIAAAIDASSLGIKRFPLNISIDHMTSIGIKDKKYIISLIGMGEPVFQTDKEIRNTAIFQISIVCLKNANNQNASYSNAWNLINSVKLYLQEIRTKVPSIYPLDITGKVLSQSVTEVQSAEAYLANVSFEAVWNDVLDNA